MPPAAAAAVAVPKSSRASTDGSRAWVCVSMTPGRTSAPSRSTVSRAVGSPSPVRTTATIRPPSIASDPGISPSGVASRPPVSTSSTSTRRQPATGSAEELVQQRARREQGTLQSEPSEQPVERFDRDRRERRRRLPHGRMGDGSAHRVHVLADGEVDERLVLEADEGREAVEQLRRPVGIPAEPATDDGHEHLREAEARHRPVGAGCELLEQHPGARARPRSTDRGQLAQPADLRRRRLVLELDDPGPRRLLGELGHELRRHRDARARRDGPGRRPGCRSPR